MPRITAQEAAGITSSEAQRIHYRTKTVGGVEVFYREAGPKNAPTLLLLHGFPTSSHMFRTLIPALADNYHVIAPDLPGFGFTQAPESLQLRLHFRKSSRNDSWVHGGAWP